MRFRALVWALAALLVAGAAGAAWAQEQAGGIQGVVKDSSGAVLPGVTVEARNVSVAGSQTAITDDQGRYRFPALPPGTYEVTATLQGFTTAKIGNAVIELGKLLTIDLALAVAGVAETVQVTGESPLIDVKQNATFATVQAETIARIPKGRDFTGVIAMAAGANDEARTGGISVGGASGSENRFIVDGMDTTSLRTGVSQKSVVTDFVQEVQVKTSGYNAEFGGATGGVVSAITKSGSNSLRGSAGIYYTNNGPTGVESKDNSNFFKGQQRPALRLLPTDTTKAQYYTVPLNDVPDSQPVFDIGGPIMRDKLWFYVGYAPVRTSTSRTVTFTSTKQTQTFVQDNPVDRLNTNLTGQITNNMRFRFSYAPTWSKSRGSIPGNIEPDGTSTSSATTDYASSGSNSWNDSYSGTFDWAASNSFYVNVMGGYFMYDTETLGAGTAITHTFQNNNNTYPDIPASLIQPSGYVDGKSSSRTVQDKYSRAYVNATATWFKSAKGQHAIKGGVRFERLGNGVYSGRTEPNIDLYWNSQYGMNDGSGSRTGKYGYYVVSKGVVNTGDIHSDNWSLFLQDSWSPTSRLTINAGVRMESEKVPFYSDTMPDEGLDFGFGDKLAPRVGFAYDIKGDGRWKAYGSFGRYFDITKLEMPRGSFGGEKWISYAWALDTYDWPNIKCQEGKTGCPGTFYEQTVWRFGSNEIDPEFDAIHKKYFGKSGNWIDPDIKPVQSQSVVFGLDHELSPVISVGARYTHSWVTRTIEDFGWNEPGVGEMYIIGNPGDGAWGDLGFLWGPGKLYTTGTVVPMPAPVRDYDAVEFSLKKRLSNRWSGQVVYTWSRLWGNFPGLASSDEGGRTSPNVNRMYDSIWLMYDTTGSKKEVLGNLNTDRPSYLKAQFTYDTPWGTMVGFNYSGRSGALYSDVLNYQGYNLVFYKGRGSLGRSPFESQFDLLLQHDFRLGKRYVLNLNLNAFNLFDSDTATVMFANPYRDRWTLSPPEAFFNGFNPDAQAAAAPATYRPDARYKLDSGFLGRRDIRIGASFRF
jgi:Carboxypeptidase regulatory-like domain/TonB dependent receptor